MRSLLSPLQGPRRWVLGLLAGCLLAGLPWTTSHLDAAGKKFLPRQGMYQAQKPQAPLPPKSALLTAEDWQKAPLTPLLPGEIDQLVARDLQTTKALPAPRTTDEQFLRRVSLDLTGQLPLPADVTEFVADRDPNKRSHLIDRLLQSDDYARHWARYWREVVTARLPDARFAFLAGGYEDWMDRQLKANRSWADIARDMITATGELRFTEPGKNGAAFFLGSHRGTDADSERAAETSRIFLGIQIQCAQCHDHPFDQWKRVQFHELAGYFARMREKPVREGNKVIGFELVSAPRGEHLMPDKKDPKQGLVTPPRFLDGASPGNNLDDLARRQALARAIIRPDDYWFGAAYVNRVWGVLMGQSFYEPVDDMGPGREAVFPDVLTRLTGSFRGSQYNTKELLRAILNSDTYQRQIRLSEAGAAHLHFAAAYPTRLPADALWQSLEEVLGRMGGPTFLAYRPNKRNPVPQGLEGLVKQEFDLDPSLKAGDVEGSISQALLLMNNGTLNQRLKAQGTNLLGRILKAYPADEDALHILYLRVLARKPTDRELETCRGYLQSAPSRAEGYEDILWALLNSTEFQTKR